MCTDTVTCSSDEDMLFFVSIARDELSKKLEAHTNYNYNSYANNLVDPRVAALQRQLERLDKRVNLSVEDARLEQNAYENFIAVNEQASQPIDFTREEFGYILSDAREFIERALLHVRKDSVIPLCLDYEYLIRLWKFGPGAMRGTDSTHIVDKLNDRFVTVTRNCRHHATFVLNSTTLGLMHYANSSSGKGLKVVDGSKMIFVPKDRTKFRAICSEPGINMCMQLAAATYIEQALAGLGNKISDQSFRNKYAAFLGSLGPLHNRAELTPHELSTIDLKNASDLIRPSLIKELWPEDWYCLLMQLRCERTRIDLSDGTSRSVDLHMLSTMGNGFTFPVMTLTLLALCYGVFRETEGRRNPKTKWRRFMRMPNSYMVFGDDIIVPTESYPRMCEVLQMCGLVVNEAKSYASGGFRESCGLDSYLGVDITPFYVESLSCEAEVYIAINKINRWCEKHDVRLPITLRFLTSRLTLKPLLVPEWEEDYAGIKTPDCPRRYKKLEIVPWVKEIPTHMVHIKLLSNGCLTSGNGNKARYSPRNKEIQYRVVEGRLTPGFRHGGLPREGNPHLTSCIQLNSISTYSICPVSRLGRKEERKERE